MSRRVAVLKIGGSVLTGARAYRQAAEFIAARLCAAPDERTVVVVSAETGVTDALLATAREIVERRFEPAPVDRRREEREPLRLRALLASHDVVVVPGFLARGAGDAVVSLGRGGSDLTAVLLAAGLDACRCELVKDVPGYFTADPKRDPGARPLDALSFTRAIEMADAGCRLVQRHALVAAQHRHLPLVVRAIGHRLHTVIQ